MKFFFLLQTFASDVFALGCVYYFVLTDGKFAFGDAIRCQSNILDDRPLLSHADVQHGCVQNLLFLKTMIAKDSKSRPTCSTFLTYPLFWTTTDRLKFLHKLRDLNEGALDKFKNFQSQFPCNQDHDEEVEVLKKLKLGIIGSPSRCLLPFAYLKSLKSEKEFEEFCDFEFPSMCKDNKADHLQTAPFVIEYQPKVEELKQVEFRNEFKDLHRKLLEIARLKGNEECELLESEQRLEGWLSIPNKQNIRKYGWINKYVEVASNFIIFSNQPKQFPTQIINLRLVVACFLLRP